MLGLSRSPTAADLGIDVRGIYHSGLPDSPAGSSNAIVSAFISSPATYSSSSSLPLSLRPGQMLASRLTAYFRKKCVTVTDRRVRLMNEILGCIKFIKMYCWEDAFAQNVHSESASSSHMTQQLHHTPVNYYFVCSYYFSLFWSFLLFF